MGKILIIDDSDSIRATIETILRELDYEVISVENGKEALKALETTGPVSLMITDIFMPEMDGIEVIEQTKSIYPDTKIIAISAGGMGIKGQEMLEIASSLGAQKVVNKPFSNEDITSAVATVLKS
ncbi:MAG: response regulator [Verrucomicrobiota bacterium]